MNRSKSSRLTQDVVQQIRSALVTTSDERVREALLAALNLLSSNDLTEESDVSTGFDGSIDHTFHDEECEPHGREMDVRIYYSWDNYDRADEPFSDWGAGVVDVKMLDVRYLDDEGKEIDLEAYHHELAWHLVMKHEESILESCTEDGYRNDVGHSHPLYTPNLASPTHPRAEEISLRMAPSVPTRQQEQQRRHQG